MPRSALPTTHRDRSQRLEPTAPRVVLALGTWAAVVGLAGALALLGGAAPAGSSDTDTVTVMAASASEAVVLTSAGAPVPPTTAVLPTTVTTAVPTTLPPAPVPTSPPTTDAPPPPAEAPPATDPPAPVADPAPAPAPAAPATVGPDVDAAAEAALLDDHNQRRAAAGLPPLLRDPCLDEVARGWARQMAGRTTLQHNPRYAEEIDGCITYTAAGENVGHGPDIPSMAAAFWASDSHRANIVGPFQYVGIGVVNGPDGARWAAIEFAGA